MSLQRAYDYPGCTTGAGSAGDAETCRVIPDRRCAVDIVRVIVTVLVLLLVSIGVLAMREGIQIRCGRRASKTMPTIEDRHRTIGHLSLMAATVVALLVVFINILYSRSAPVARPETTAIVGQARATGAVAMVAMVTPSVPATATAYAPSAAYPRPYPSSTPHPTPTCPPFVQWPTATAVLNLSASRAYSRP